jgi:PKD repeat protein
MKSAKWITRWCSLWLLFLVFILPVAHAQTELFFDDFEGTTLITGPDGWTFLTNVGNNGYYTVGQGQLTLYSGTTDGGGGFVNSNRSFSVASDNTNTLVLEVQAKTSSTDGGAWGFQGYINDDLWNYNDGLVTMGIDRQTGWLRAGIRSSRDQATTYLPIPGPQVDVTEWHHYKIEVSSADVKFYIDNELRLTHASNIPVGKPMRVILDRVSRGVWETLSVDYAKVTTLQKSVNQLTDSLIVCLPFDGNINDSYGSVNTLVLGSPEFTDISKLGSQALSLNESGVEDLIRVDVAPPREDFTYMAWINPRDAEGQSLVFSSWYTYYNDAFRMGLMRNLVWAYIENGYKDYSPYSMSTTSINNDLWYHIVGVKNGNVLTVYVNGVEEGSYNGWPTTLTPAPMFFGIGNTPVSPNPFFAYNGIVDDVAVWSRALSLEEVSAIYNDGLGKSCASLKNSPPVVNAAGPYTGEEGSSIILSGATAYDADDDSLAYSWSLDSEICTVSDTYDLNPSVICEDDGIFTAILTVSDGINDPISDRAIISVSNTTPSIDSLFNNGPITEGETAIVTINATDPGGSYDSLSYAFDCDGDSIFEIEAQPENNTQCIYEDNGDYTVVVQVLDEDGGQTVGSTTIVVNNVPPSVATVLAPSEPIQIGTLTNASAVFSDPGVLDTHAATWEWGDGATSTGVVDEESGSGTAFGDHSYTSPGVYTVQLTITDKDGDYGKSVYQYIVVYDPNGGFVTGGGWINSPAGAYIADPALVGKAHFGFVAKYQKGANIPTGNTEFQFKAGDLNFKSTAYDWLVVAGAKAQFKGVGTINGAGEYGFMLTAIDGQVNGGGGTDKFRIKIWDKTTDAIVYDNQMGATDDAQPSTVLGGGSIVIHK